MISKELELILQNMYADAQRSHYEMVGLEHLLVALIEYSSEVLEVLHHCNVDSKILLEQLYESIKENTPILPKDSEIEPKPTLGFQRVIQSAIIHAHSAEKRQVLATDVLVAMFTEQNSPAVYFMELQSLTRYNILRYISHGIGTHDENTESENKKNEQQHSENPLEDYAINLNEAVRTGRIDPLIGRQNEIERMIQILCRRRKNNPLLVGEAGVGKTALVEGLAYRIEHHQVPEVLAKAVIYSLDMGALLAGTKYRGDFEARVKKVLKALEKIPHAILFIDEIHTIIGAGSTQGGTMDASNLLKPALTQGRLRCIGATTYEEYRTIFSKDHALSRRFQKIDIIEPSVEETVLILKGLKSAFEAHHGVEYGEDALEAAAQLSSKYINERFLPDKAIDIIDEAGAAQRLLPENKRLAIIDKEHIEAVVAKIARIPEKTVSHDDKKILKHLARDLKKMVFGQDNAIEAVVAAVKMSRSGLAIPDKPVGSFLFSGPTGVGKTEVARQLACILGLPLQRFDMSEYMESHAVSRLIGAPPGYVGYEQAGLLTDAVTKQPHCILLLDEIEKAHRDIYNVLLQVMDYGKLTDNTGKSADFRNVILIMTTNAGAEALGKASLGFTGKNERGDEMKDIKKQFTPEFRNRLDAIVPFAPLTSSVITRVVDKFLLQLEHQLLEKQVKAEFSEALRTHLAEKGFDPQMGARPMNRLIRDEIRSVLADELLFGRLVQGGKVYIDWDVETEKVVLSFPEK